MLIFTTCLRATASAKKLVCGDAIQTVSGLLCNSAGAKTSRLHKALGREAVHRPYTLELLSKDNSNLSLLPAVQMEGWPLGVFRGFFSGEPGNHDKNAQTWKSLP